MLTDFKENWLSLKNTVQLQQNKITNICNLKIGDYIKTANYKFCHNIQNKLSCIADIKNVMFSKISNIYVLENSKSVVHIVTQSNKNIYISLDCNFTVMRFEDGLNNYYSKPLYDILDSYQPNNFDYHGSYYKLITQNGIELIKTFEFVQNTEELINIETEDNNRIFVGGILL